MRTVEERFWRFVQVFPGCWDWSGFKDKNGYSRLNVGKLPKLAHRLSLQIHGIDVPDDLCVLHTCDNPSCCNPKHLRIGTKGENNADMRLKKRSARGQRNGKAKLTNAEAIAIKAGLDRGESGKSLADQFNISQATVSSIRHGTRWIYLSELIDAR